MTRVNETVKRENIWLFYSFPDGTFYFLTWSESGAIADAAHTRDTSWVQKTRQQYDSLFFLLNGHVLAPLQKKITGGFSRVRRPQRPLIVDLKLTGEPQRAAVSALGLRLTAGSPLGLTWLFIIHYQQKHSMQLRGQGSVPMMQCGTRAIFVCQHKIFLTVKIRYSRLVFVNIYCKHSAKQGYGHCPVRISCTSADNAAAAQSTYLLRRRTSFRRLRW